MRDEEFDDYFKVLQDASDRLRTVIYAFIIVNIALLLYAISAFVYPVNQFAYDTVNLNARCVIDVDKTTNNADLGRSGGASANVKSDPSCAPIAQWLKDHKVTPDMSHDVSVSIWEHQLANAYDESVKTRSFSFPVFGLQTDRDILWIMFPLVGIIGYYILLLALDSVNRTFSYLLDSNPDHPVRQRLLHSTLVITTPLKNKQVLNAIKKTELSNNSKKIRIGKKIREVPDAGVIIQYMWRVLALLICSIPIMVVIMMMLDQINLIPALIFQKAGEILVWPPSLGLGTKLSIEALLLACECWLLYILVLHGLFFGKCQAEVEALIPDFDGLAPPAQKSGVVTPREL